MFKRLIWLVILFAVVWAAVVFWPEKAEQPMGGPRWPGFSAADVSYVAVNSTRGSLAMEKRKDAWYMTGTGGEVEPRADKAKIEALLNYITYTEPIRRLNTGDFEELSDYGLDDPEITLTVISKEPWVLEVGSANPAGDGVYARVSGKNDALFVLDPGYRSQLTQEPGFFFDLRILNPDLKQVRKLRVAGADRPDWEISRVKDGYAFTRPADATDKPVSEDEADYYLHTLRTLKASGLVLKPVNLSGPPELVVEISAGDQGKIHKIEVYPVGENGLYPCRSTWQPVVFELDESRFEQIDKRAFDLQDRGIIELDLGRVQKITIFESGRELSAQKTESGWKNRNGEELLGVDTLLWVLSDIKAQGDPVDFSPEGMKHQLTVSLLDKDGNSLVMLSFYTDPQLPEGKAWLMVHDQSVYYPVSDEALKNILGQLPPSTDNGAKPGKGG